MEKYILTERPLTDDILMLSSEGKLFKGGYIAIIQYHTFKNAWTDNTHTKRFRNKDRLLSYIEKRYPDFDRCF
jgi:hypothetical protein